MKTKPELLVTLSDELLDCLSLTLSHFRALFPRRAARSCDRAARGLDGFRAWGMRADDPPQAAGASPWSRICRSGPPSF